MKTKVTRIAVIMSTVLFMMVMVSAAYAAEKMKPAAGKTEMAPASKHQSMTFTGMIVANKNKKGKIVSYGLHEDNGQELMLSKHGKGMELRKMVGSKIEATGTVQESKSGKWITVEEFKKIE